MNSYQNMSQLDRNELYAQWKWLLLMGVSLAGFGALAILFATISTLFSVINLGVFLVIAGMLEAVKAFKINMPFNNFVLLLCIAILFVVSGGYMILHPVQNAISLTLFLAIVFIVSGIIKIAFAFYRRFPHRSLMVLNGCLTVLLGLVIWSQWPISGLWAIGTLVGVDALFAGIMWIAVALQAKNFNRPSQ